MNYITAEEASKKWNIGTRRICILCKEGRIPGAIKKSRIWLIPENAGKPQDERKSLSKQNDEGFVLEPISLIYNFTRAELEGKLNKIEKSICEVQSRFMKGDLENAYSEINRLINSCEDDKYRAMLLVIKYAISADLGKMEAFIEIENELSELICSENANPIERMLLLYYSGKIKSIDVNGIDEKRLDEIMPFICMISFKKGVNGILHNISNIAILGPEIICYELDKRDSVLISAYCHLYLAVYYNAVGEKESFEKHYNKALGILLPRKWYTPLAEYSATINIEYIEKIDREAYHEIVKLSEKIVGAYIRIGLFDNIPGQTTINNDIAVRISYLIFQGKSNMEIAEKMNMSQYRIKQYVDEMLLLSGAGTKKEFRELVSRNLYV